MNFGPSAKRLLRPAAPRAARRRRRHRARRRQRRARASIGPKILGDATDLIFAGVIGKQLPAGRHPAAGGRRAAGRGPGQPRRPARRRWTTSCPARASTSPRWARSWCSSWRSTSVAALLQWLQGRMLTGVVSRTIYRLRRDVEDKLDRLPLPYFDQQPRGELLSRVTNDIDNVAQSLQQTLSQLLTSLLTVVGVLAMMFWISPLLALSRWSRSRSRWSSPAMIGKRVQKHFVAAVEEHRRAQRRDRGDVHRPRAGQGLRPPAGGRAGSSPSTTTRSTTRASGPSSSPASSCRR